MTKSPARRLAAIMFTDIVGYSALMQKDEVTAAATRKRHRETFESKHKEFHGEIIQYYGDGTLSIFGSAVEAVQCAAEIQAELSSGNPIVPLRIGLHLGDIVHTGTEVYGDSVNVTARIEHIGVTGSVLISEKINSELKNHHIKTLSMGKFDFKNIAQPMEVFAVDHPGIHVPQTDELQGKKSNVSTSVAVLPFVNMSANKDNEFFSDGMTEEIINALTGIKELKVTSRTSSFFFKNKTIPIQEIGQQLGVSILLQGSVRLAGNKMRISAQLVNVENDEHFWSETFDRSFDDIFAVQDEISLLIADKLREHTGHFEISDQLVEAPGVPPSIYKRYLQSRYQVIKMNKPDLEEGLSVLLEITDQYKSFTPAFLGVSMAYTLTGALGFMPAGEAWMKGKPYLDKAIELDKDHPECLLQQSWISFFQDWDLPAAYAYVNKTLEIRPVVDAYQTMTSMLTAEGKLKAAHHYIDTALEIDPLSEITHHLKGYTLYLEEKYEESLVYFRKSIALKEGSHVSLLYLGQALIQMGKAGEALEYFQNLPQGTDELYAIGGTVLANAALGNKKKVALGIGKIKTYLESESMERAINLLVLCYTLEKKYDKAVEMVEKGMEYHLPLIVYLNVEPMLKPLHEVSRFKELMGQIFGDTQSHEEHTRKYKKSLLNPELLSQYHDQLKDLMITEQPHLNPNLTLRDLADQMEIPANQFSQLLNEGFNQNFSEFINAYRLETFKEKVADPKNSHLTLLAIAYDSGFNSKTVFNTYFKKVTGQTPKAYMKTITQK